MIAYNQAWLNNLYARQDIEDAFDENIISREEQAAAFLKYPVGFYTPNIFIRIGLFVLTVIIILFTYALFALLFYSANDNTMGNLAIFLGLVSYSFLEYMVRVKKHYRSGVDDALLWISALSIFCGMSLPYGFGMLLNCMIIFILALYCCLRFADRLMAVVAYISMLGIIFYTCIELGTTAKAVVPFIIMTASLIIYFLMKKISTSAAAIHYRDCIDMIIIISLVSFYAAGNYYIVRELSNEMFDMNLRPGDSIPFGWLFWIFTVSIPVIYIARGILKKDAILIRVGMLLVAAIVFTVRYYHTILPVETIMAISGIVLMAIGYLLMKYLHEPKYGFTYQELAKKNAMDKLNIESLVIAETFAPGADNGNTKFGGGSFGGGGSSSEF